MGRHRAGPVHRWLLPAAAVVVAVAAVLALTHATRRTPAPGATEPAAATRPPCERAVRVVTASSFAPVVAAAAEALRRADGCARVDVVGADGRDAAVRAAGADADVWIPDDAAWAVTAGGLDLAPQPTAGAGTTLAVSPFYLIADARTGARLRAAGGGWRDLARLADTDPGVRLVLRDPAGSGDGMLAAGALAEAVWLDEGMDPSALWLFRARAKTRTVTDGRPALPTRAGEVGVVPEYALLPSFLTPDDGTVLLRGADRTAQLRFTWLPRRAALADAPRAALIDRLFRELTGPRAPGYLTTANLRTPDGQRSPTGGEVPQPPEGVRPLGVLGPHHVDHVFAAWYPADRRTDLLVAVDVSGSMADPAGDGGAARIDLVKQGCRRLAALLPGDSRLALWEFGSELDGGRDWRSLVSRAPLDAAQRRRWSAAVDRLDDRETGTGLYDTILAAYRAGRDAYREGLPNQVLLFTDGRNENDDRSLDAAGLARALRATADPRRPVMLSVVTFGTEADAKTVETAVAPVDGYVDRLTRAEEVDGVFLHVAAGGLHG